MIKSTKNQALRDLIFELVVAKMEAIRAKLKDTSEINHDEYLLLYDLFLELAPDEAISQLIVAFQEKGLVSTDPIKFEA